MTDDRDTLAAFVVWGLRHGDLPPDVQDAALRVASRYPRPRTIGYTEGPYRVTGFPPDETTPLTTRRCQRWQIGHVVQEIAPRSAYVLVDDAYAHDRADGFA